MLFADVNKSLSTKVFDVFILFTGMNLFHSKSIQFIFRNIWVIYASNVNDRKVVHLNKDVISLQVANSFKTNGKFLVCIRIGHVSKQQYKLLAAAPIRTLHWHMAFDYFTPKFIDSIISEIHQSICDAPS